MDYNNPITYLQTHCACTLPPFTIEFVSIVEGLGSKLKPSHNSNHLEIICYVQKKQGAQLTMESSSNDSAAPRAIEKIKILGAVLELPAK